MSKLPTNPFAETPNQEPTANQTTDERTAHVAITPPVNASGESTGTTTAYSKGEKTGKRLAARIGKAAAVIALFTIGGYCGYSIYNNSSAHLEHPNAPQIDNHTVAMEIASRYAEGATDLELPEGALTGYASFETGTPIVQSVAHSAKKLIENAGVAPFSSEEKMVNQGTILESARLFMDESREETGGDPQPGDTVEFVVGDFNGDGNREAIVTGLTLNDTKN